MSYSKRIWSILLILLLLAFCIFGNFYPSTQGDKSVASSKPIIVWYTNPEMEAYMNEAAFMYEDEYGADVEPLLVSGLEYLDSIQRASLQDNAGPDVFIVSNDSIESAYLSGIAYEVEDPDNVLNDEFFSDNSLDAVSYRGRKVGYPLYFDTAVLVYNKTYLEEIASKVAENEANAALAEATFIQAQNAENAENTENTGEQAESIAEGYVTDPETGEVMSVDDYKNKISGLYTAENILPSSIVDILEFANKYEPPENVDTFFEWCVRDVLYDYWFAGAYLNVGGEHGDDNLKVDLYNENALYCLSVFQDFNQFFSIESETTDYDSVINDFIGGKTVFTVADTDIIGKLENAKLDGSFAYEYDVLPITKLNETLKSQGLSVTHLAMVNAYGDKTGQAESFARFISTEYAGNMYSRTGKVCACKNVEDAYPQMEGVRDTYENSVSLPKVVESSNYWVMSELMFTRIWNGNDVNSELRSLSEQMKGQLFGVPCQDDVIMTPEITEAYLDSQ